MPDGLDQAQIKTGSSASLLTAKTAFLLSCKSPRNNPMHASSRTRRIVVKAPRRAKTSRPTGPWTPSRMADDKDCSPIPTTAERTNETMPTLATAVSIRERALLFVRG